MKARTLPAGRAPSSPLDRSRILVHRDGTDPASTVRAHIQALGVTPAQVRAWCEAEGVPLPRHGVDLDAVTAYADAHPKSTQEATPCPTPAPAAPAAPPARRSPPKPLPRR